MSLQYTHRFLSVDGDWNVTTLPDEQWQLLSLSITIRWPSVSAISFSHSFTSITTLDYDLQSYHRFFSYADLSNRDNRPVSTSLIASCCVTKLRFVIEAIFEGFQAAWLHIFPRGINLCPTVYLSLPLGVPKMSILYFVLTVTCFLSYPKSFQDFPPDLRWFIPFSVATSNEL